MGGRAKVQKCARNVIGMCGDEVMHLVHTQWSPGARCCQDQGVKHLQTKWDFDESAIAGRVVIYTNCT